MEPSPRPALLAPNDPHAAMSANKTTNASTRMDRRSLTDR
jgi:hypothetical protein